MKIKQTYKQTLEEYEGQHTNFIGNIHEDEDSLDKAIHDFLLSEVHK